MAAPTKKPIIVQISENSFSQSLHAFIGNKVVKFPLNFLFEIDENLQNTSLEEVKLSISSCLINKLNVFLFSR